MISLAVACGAPAAQANNNEGSLSELTLEQLLDVEVISAAQRPQRQVEVPSAVYVITAEAIRRSGITTVPEALRLAPGMQVAKQFDSQWVISARGFETTFANKLLVLIDGRTVYSPLFSGVFWDIQTPPLNDIDRIEVIRGPGATIWGANAVNGVINIITRSAKDTDGTRIMARGGKEERGAAELSHTFSAAGGAMRTRFSGTIRYRDEQIQPNGDRSFDDSRIMHTNARTDWTLGPNDMLTLDGGWYNSVHGLRTTLFRPDYSDNLGTLTDTDLEAWGGTSGVHWDHTFSERATTELALLYDRRAQRSGLISERRGTGEIDFQNNLRIGDSQQLVWGLGWRRQDDRIGNTPDYVYNHTRDTLSRYGGFAQDEIELGHGVALTVGSKLSWETYTGWDAQPSARLRWNVAEHHLLWAAVSRAVRTPARQDRDANIALLSIPPSNTPVFLIANPDFENEVVIATEAGYRVQPRDNVSFDLAIFGNNYENVGKLRGFPPQFINVGENHSFGGELAANWLALPWLHLSGSWTNIQINNIKRTPKNQYQLHGSMDLPHGVEVDLGYFFQGPRKVPDANLQDNLRVNSFSRWDLRLGWTPKPGVELSLVGQDLLDRHHLEFFYPGSGISEVERAIYGQVVLAF